MKKIVTFILSLAWSSFGQLGTGPLGTGPLGMSGGDTVIFACGVQCTVLCVAASAGYKASMAGRPYKSYPNVDTLIFTVTENTTIVSIARLISSSGVKRWFFRSFRDRWRGWR